MSVLLTLVLPVAASCADAAKTPEKSEVSGQTASGTVVETMNSGGYSYARLKKNDTTTWVAFPTQETRINDTLSFGSCTPMPDFQSKSLNRKFDLILFCGAPETTAKPGASADKKSPGSVGAVSAATQKIAVEKASGANAYTIAQLHAKGAALNGKKVVVRGQVMKVATRIMSRNWIHLQDGSGSAKQKNHDLVVTSSDLPKVGEVVTVSGILAKDKDFGGGYKYSVIIEQGSVLK